MFLLDIMTEDIQEEKPKEEPKWFRIPYYYSGLAGAPYYFFREKQEEAEQMFRKITHTVPKNISILSLEEALILEAEIGKRRIISLKNAKNTWYVDYTKSAPDRIAISYFRKKKAIKKEEEVDISEDENP